MRETFEVMLDEALLEEASKLGIDLSTAAEAGIAKAVSDARHLPIDNISDRGATAGEPSADSDQ